MLLKESQLIFGFDRTRGRTAVNAESMGRSMVDQAERQRVLKVLTAATFLVFAQAFMVAPLIPRLAEIFQVAPETIGIVVPAYLIP